MAKNETASAEQVQTGIEEAIDGASVPATVETVEGEAVEGEAAGGSTQTEGVRARRAFMLKQFIPNPDWINVNVVSKGKGARATVGRIFGVVTGTEDKHNVLPDGTPSVSIVCKGILQSENYMTGEVSEASMVFLPMAYAEKIKSVFSMDPNVKVVEIDCDIGLEATGKTIPYEWVVTAYREGEEMAVLKRLKHSRPRPTSLLTGPATAAIADQSNG